MKLVKWLLIVDMLFGLCLFLGSYSFHVFAKTSFLIPKTLHRLQGIFASTHYVGTIKHPTIDGGIINSTDISIINYDKPQ